MKKLLHNQGFTLLEVVIAMGIFTLLIVGISNILIVGLQSNAIIWEQLTTQNDGRQALQEIVDDLRRAETSSVGSYPLLIVSDNEIAFFANIDEDVARERVRYWVENEHLYKGVVDPSGAPLQYVTSTESVKTIAESVKNIGQGTPVFEYFGEAYTSTSTPLAHPIDSTEVRLVRVQLELEKDPTQTPVPLHVEAMVHIRNLKEN
jgi:prepilin-type N-terminal cleavage/methylation domain-containing protein